MSECKCSWSISALGDGCRYCQPQEYIDQLADALEDTIDTTDHAEEMAKLLAEAVIGQEEGFFGSDLLGRINKSLTNYREATK
jgi:hypothetical protein